MGPHEKRKNHTPPRSSLPAQVREPPLGPATAARAYSRPAPTPNRTPTTYYAAARRLMPARAPLPGAGPLVSVGLVEACPVLGFLPASVDLVLDPALLPAVVGVSPGRPRPPEAIKEEVGLRLDRCEPHSATKELHRHTRLTRRRLQRSRSNGNCVSSRRGRACCARRRRTFKRSKPSLC